MSEAQQFRLDNQGEVTKFEQKLFMYLESKGYLTVIPFSLAQAYGVLDGHENKGKLFASLFDILISHLHLNADKNSIYGTWNDLFSKGKLEGGSILDCDDRFIGKVDIHRFATSYVTRYRALWDKIMGYLVLRHVPTEYERFISARSRKSKFRQIASNTPAIDSAIAEAIEELSTKIDDAYRTAETHGTGVLRKSLFLMQSFDDAANPLDHLGGFWNDLTFVLNAIMKEFVPASGQVTIGVEQKSSGSVVN
jgi:hypothetical protein